MKALEGVGVMSLVVDCNVEIGEGKRQWCLTAIAKECRLGWMEGEDEQAVFLLNHKKPARPAAPKAEDTDPTCAAVSKICFSNFVAVCLRLSSWFIRYSHLAFCCKNVSASWGKLGLSQKRLSSMRKFCRKLQLFCSVLVLARYNMQSTNQQLNHAVKYARERDYLEKNR